MAIARALARRAPLCILDEPTAALDPMSESRFYTQFGELTRGRTTIFISHRLGSTALSDSSTFEMRRISADEVNSPFTVGHAHRPPGTGDGPAHALAEK